MKAIIMAGGYATRMYPLTLDKPKTLLEVAGKPILQWIIEDVSSIKEINQIIIVTNQKYDTAIREWSVSFGAKDLLIMTSDSTCENNKRGAIADVLWAIEEKAIDDDLLIMASDTLLDISLCELIDFYYETGRNNICVISYPERDKERLSFTGVAQILDNKVIQFHEKPQDPKYTNAIPPYYIYPARTLSMIGTALNQGCCPDSLGYLIEWLFRKTDIMAMELNGKRYDCGSIERYLYTKEHYKGIKRK